MTPPQQMVPVTPIDSAVTSLVSPGFAANSNMVVDGFCFEKYKSGRSRYDKGPQRSNSAWAIYCLLVVALVMDAGRLIYDQRPFDEKPCPMTQVITKAMQRDWASLSPPQINDVRDVVGNLVHEAQGCKFASGYLSLCRCADDGFRGLPQICFSPTYMYEVSGCHWPTHSKKFRGRQLSRLRRDEDHYIDDTRLPL